MTDDAMALCREKFGDPNAGLSTLVQPAAAKQAFLMGCKIKTLLKKSGQAIPAHPCWLGVEGKFCCLAVICPIVRSQLDLGVCSLR